MVSPAPDPFFPIGERIRISERTRNAKPNFSQPSVGPRRSRDQICGQRAALEPFLLTASSGDECSVPAACFGKFSAFARFP